MPNTRTSKAFALAGPGGEPYVLDLGRFVSENPLAAVPGGLNVPGLPPTAESLAAAKSDEESARRRAGLLNRILDGQRQEQDALTEEIGEVYGDHPATKSVLEFALPFILNIENRDEKRKFLSAFRNPEDVSDLLTKPDVSALKPTAPDAEGALDEFNRGQAGGFPGAGGASASQLTPSGGGGGGFSLGGIAEGVGLLKEIDGLTGGKLAEGAKNLLSKIPGIGDLFKPGTLTQGVNAAAESAFFDGTSALSAGIHPDAVSAVGLKSGAPLGLSPDAASAVGLESSITNVAPRAFASKAAANSGAIGGLNVTAGLPAGATLLTPAQEAAAIATGWTTHAPSTFAEGAKLALSPNAAAAGGAKTLSAWLGQVALPIGAIMSIPTIANTVKGLLGGNDHTQEARQIGANKVAELLFTGNNLERAKALLGQPNNFEDPNPGTLADFKVVQRAVEKAGGIGVLPEASRPIFQAQLDRIEGARVADEAGLRRVADQQGYAGLALDTMLPGDDGLTVRDVARKARNDLNGP